MSHNRIDARSEWLVLPLAYLIDILIGDPPNRWHPVAWMGELISRLRSHAPKDASPYVQFAYGIGLVTGGMALCASAGWGVKRLAKQLPRPLALLVEAFLLNMTFAATGLVRAGRSVQAPLVDGNLDHARHQLSWHLVSRDTSQLNEAQIAAATVESLAENTSDSVVAPLLFYASGGLPAALAYRYLNTADAMLGYRDAEREWLGKASARLDDLANLIPARLTALLMILYAYFSDSSAQSAWAIWRRDARKTASPNAGHPMSAAAGALEIELEKVGHYTLGAGLRRARWQDIERAISVVQWVTLTTVGLGIVIERVVRELEKKAQYSDDKEGESSCFPK